jgi:hypothetical protein
MADDPPCEACGQPVECIHRIRCERITADEYEQHIKVYTRKEI